MTAGLISDGPSGSMAGMVTSWFVDAPEPHLVGHRCRDCATVAFPPTLVACPSPDCSGGQLEETPLSRRGRVWSYAVNHYPPPEPYVRPDPFEPYTVVAVELEAERLVVLGQLEGDAVAVGDEVELVAGALADGEPVWKWRRA